MRAAQAVDHLLRPVEVLAAPRQVPFRRRPLGDVARVAELVGELHQLRLVRQLRRVLDLQALALGLGQALVVGDLGDDARDARAEGVDQLLVAGGGVLDRVVQQRRAQHLEVGDAALVHQHVGERDRMVDVGRGVGVLAALVAVLVGGEGQRLKKKRELALHDAGSLRG